MFTRAPRDWLAPTNRCRSAPSRSQTEGSRASRADMPGTSPTAPSSPSTTNQPKLSPHTSSTTGSRAQLAAEIRSAPTLTVRRFTRSSTAPPTTPQTNWGTAQISASEPAASTSPVRAKSTNGSTTPAIELPTSESASDSRYRRTAPLNMGSPSNQTVARGAAIHSSPRAACCCSGPRMIARRGLRRLVGIQNYDVTSGSTSRVSGRGASQFLPTSTPASKDESSVHAMPAI